MCSISFKLELNVAIILCILPVAVDSHSGVRTCRILVCGTQTWLLLNKENGDPGLDGWKTQFRSLYVLQNAPRLCQAIILSHRHRQSIFFRKWSYFKVRGFGRKA
jgi:hypothetical protein